MKGFIMRKSILNSWGLTASAIAFGAVSGCAGLPEVGPSASDVSSQQFDANQGQKYVVVDINSTSIEKLKSRGVSSFSAKFGDSRLSAEPRIGVGDSVVVTIWEASAGGLFSAPMLSDKVSAGSNSAAIPEQVVGRDGGITVPYAGRIIVSGQTTRAVQATIEQALQGKAIQPQVLVNVTRPVSNSVSVGGEVAAGARVPLSVKGDRMLDVLAMAGGVRAPVNETFVELSRGAITSRIPLSRVIDNPRENIYLHPNDVLTLVRDPQTFIVQGATGANAQIPFDADGITLAQALAKAGGLNDNRSDPHGVFVFRYEYESVARQLAPGSPVVVSSGLTPVVYRLDLGDTNSLFMEQNFAVANHDVIYVSNSPSVDVQKVFNIFGGGLSTAASAATVGVTASTVKW